MRMARVRLDTKGRLVLPKEVLIALAVLPGDDLYFVIHGDHVLLTPAPEDYAPYLIDGSRQGIEFPDRPSQPEDWQGWEDWEKETQR